VNLKLLVLNSVQNYMKIPDFQTQLSKKKIYGGKTGRFADGKGSSKACCKKFSSADR
jgi:hypothetical protein